jgi:hypothetical protein
VPVLPKRLVLACVCAAASSCVAPDAGRAVDWREIAPGMDLATFDASTGESGREITVVRIDPTRWSLELAGISQTNELAGKTAREWARSRGFAAAINAGMFDVDGVTHIGYLRAGEHAQGRRVGKYESLAAFDPRGEALAPFRIFDLDEPGVSVDAVLEDYGSVVQNLRLVKRPGENRWTPQSKRWSEAALGEDAAGRALFLFSRAPFTMHEWNEALLGAGIGLVAAQHLEGGPKAQMYVRAGDIELELYGTFEGANGEQAGNPGAWPIPNILGVRPRARRGD